MSNGESRVGRLSRLIKLLLLPGKSLAARTDEGFARFLERMEREVEAGDRELLFHKRFITAEYVAMFAAGLFLGYCGRALKMLLLLVLLLPFLALADVYASKRIFRKLSWKPRYLTSLLWCSDMVYQFALGSAIGSIVKLGTPLSFRI